MVSSILDEILNAPLRESFNYPTHVQLLMFHKVDEHLSLHRESLTKLLSIDFRNSRETEYFKND